jgi:hypothetical protein
MAKTQTELFTRALTKVGAVGAGETAAAEDVAKAREALGPLIAELDALQVVSIVLSSDEEAEEVPDEVYQALATALAIDIAADFGGAVATDEARESARSMIKRVVASGPTYEVAQALFF